MSLHGWFSTAVDPQGDAPRFMVSTDRIMLVETTATSITLYLEGGIVITGVWSNEDDASSALTEIDDYITGGINIEGSTTNWSGDLLKDPVHLAVTIAGETRTWGALP